jgi:hypothetical protein
MFTTIRTYRIAADQLDDAMHKVDKEFADQLAETEGFVAYEVLRTGDDKVATITTCRDERTALETNEAAADWIRGALPDVDMERLGTFGGEVLVSRAAQEMLVPAHH